MSAIVAAMEAAGEAIVVARQPRSAFGVAKELSMVKDEAREQRRKLKRKLYREKVGDWAKDSGDWRRQQVVAAGFQAIGFLYSFRNEREAGEKAREKARTGSKAEAKDGAKYAIEAK